MFKYMFINKEGKAMEDWKYKILEAEKGMLEIELRTVKEKLAKLLDHLKQKGMSKEELQKVLYGYDPDRENLQLKVRIDVLERENEWLRSANEALASGKQPEEVVIEAQVPKKKIKNPGRPGISPWETGQMRKLRKEGWTIREIAERYGRSVGSVQKIVAGVELDQDAVEKHRAERNQALTDAKKTARTARKKK